MSFAAKKLASVFSAFACLTQASPLKEEKPHLQDWFEASWFDGVVKIPLTIDNSEIWYADLDVWNPDDFDYDFGGKCMVDNNSPRTVIFSPEVTGQDRWMKTKDSVCDSTKSETIFEDGSIYTGLNCRQKFCIGSLVENLVDDPHTRVCNPNMYFLYATKREVSDWTSYYTNTDVVNSICGFGKEPASSKSLSFVSYAKFKGYIDQMVYSLEIQPHLVTASASSAHQTVKDHAAAILDEPVREKTARRNLAASDYQFDNEPISTLTIGGYDPNDLGSEVTYYDTSDCPSGWNLTASFVAFGEA